MNRPDYKRCSGCLMEFPREPRYFWRSVRMPDGLRRRCKQCCYSTAAYIRTRGLERRLAA